MSTTQELIRKRFEEVTAERDAMLEKTAELKREREVYNERAGAANAMALSLTEQIHAIERGGERTIIDILEERSQLARAMGGRVLSDN